MFSGMSSFQVNGKLSITFFPPSQAPAPPSAPGGPPGPGGPPPPGDPVDPPAEERWVKENVLEAVSQSLAARQDDYNRQLEEAVENLNRGFQEHLQDLEDRLDREDHRAARKRSRNN